ncbi:MAG: hypothetical protein KDA63_12520 [Planctomycetales bacterium]|nr:hypothetical protein [Planctomycetales bacterium]
MTDVVAIAWLLSIPALFLLGAFFSARAFRMWNPSNVTTRILVWSVFGINALAGLLHLGGVKDAYAGMPLIGWAGLLFLVVLWYRGLAVRYFHGA